MIVYNLFDGLRLHPSAHFQNQERTVGDALTEVVKVLRADEWYGAWIEKIHMESDASIVMVDLYGMAGERWIHFFEGPHDEIELLAEVCYWFYDATLKGSDAFKARLLRGRMVVVAPAASSAV